MTKKAITIETHLGEGRVLRLRGLVQEPYCLGVLPGVSVDKLLPFGGSSSFSYKMGVGSTHLIELS